jgi:hypothetical protein
MEVLEIIHILGAWAHRAIFALNGSLSEIQGV